MRRALISTALVEQTTPILGLDNKPLATEAGVRSAIQRVSKDLHDMFVGKGYSSGGWAIEEPEQGENGIAFRIAETVDEDTLKPNGAFFVTGVMSIRRAE